MEPPDRQSIDLTRLQVPDGHRYAVSIEKDESPQELRLRLIRELVVLAVATIFVIAIGVICLASPVGVWAIFCGADLVPASKPARCR